MTVYHLDALAPELPADGDYWIADGAVVVGRVRLGRAVGIWFGAVLRAEDEWISVGEGSNVQDGCVLHVDPGYALTIGRNCTVGHRAVLHGCTIGDGTLVGMGAKVFNGARIGRNCLIGANSLITENKVIPDGSLVLGAPGKVVRSLDETEIGRLAVSAEQYQARWHRYAAGLRVES